MQRVHHIGHGLCLCVAYSHVAGLLRIACLTFQVQAALQEVSQSPWKIVKYLFNKDVMSAIKVGTLYGSDISSCCWLEWGG